ncbi:patatin-like phospholipase family protein [Winogradskyella helgolandensis]|uniref:patatin-like phospholipase family protein n=1 Tax=Winogradskyella helgolandensis TaxID=2697010 RepID=UPI0015CDD4B4|nr:patatin-like phospholipase family protein [Winogradskyella helgolandensis]
MNLGLVLSGGGARGAAHIGVIKALEEHNVFPTHIAGTSAGAIVGGLYAAGVSWSEILDFFKSITIFSTNRYARNKPGFLNSVNFYDDLKTFFPVDNFNALKKTLFVTAANIIDGSSKIFSKGQVIKPIIASASFPGVFTPTEINGKYYVDGGTLNNFPVEPLKSTCDKIIGVYVNPLKEVSINDLKHSYSVIERAYKIKVAAESMNKFLDCDLIISPKELVDYATFGMNNIDAIFDLGYKTTKKELEKNVNLFI